MPDSDQARANIEALEAWLARNDEACPVCRYNLRGLVAPPSSPVSTQARSATSADESPAAAPEISSPLSPLVCPECNCTLKLTVASPQQSLGPWIIAIAACVLGLGFDGVVTVILSVALSFERPTSPGEFMVAATMLGGFSFLSITCASSAYALYRGRRTWMRMSVRKQRIRASLIFAGVFLLHILWAMWITIRL